jgi:predicted cupin superfamily sugar epimerase
LVGCTVGPGFEFADFLLLADAPDAASRLRARHPDLADLI